MYKTPDPDAQFIEKIKETWRVDLTAGRKSLAEVKIKKGIFQGGELLALLFVIAMMPLNHILRKRIHTQLITEKDQLLDVHGRQQTFCKNKKKKWKPLYEL